LTDCEEQTINSFLFEGHADHLAAAAESAKSAEDLFGEMQQLREDPNPIVFFKGTMVNVKHCLEQQNLLEKERQSVQDKNEQLELNLSGFCYERENWTMQNALILFLFFRINQGTA
jgi:hypothetical protein